MSRTTTTDYAASPFDSAQGKLDERVRRHLLHSVGKAREDASPGELPTAVTLAVREDLIDRRLHAIAHDVESRLRNGGPADLPQLCAQPAEAVDEVKTAFANRPNHQ